MNLLSKQYLKYIINHTDKTKYKFNIHGMNGISSFVWFRAEACNSAYDVTFTKMCMDIPTNVQKIENLNNIRNIDIRLISVNGYESKTPPGSIGGYVWRNIYDFFQWIPWTKLGVWATILTSVCGIFSFIQSVFK